MKNLELSQIFSQMSEFLEMKEDGFRARAYSRVARVLDSLERDIGDIYREGGAKALKEIPSVGQGIAEKMEEYLKTGKIKEYQKLKKESPVDVEALTKVEGIGPKKIKTLYQKLGVRNLKDLEKVARVGEIAALEGFGAKSEKNILQAIAFAKTSKGRFLLGAILPVVREVVGGLEKLPEVGQISAAGSVRRMKETVGDVDLLATSSQPDKVMEHFVSLPGIVKVWAKGPTKSSVRFKGGFDCDLRVVKRVSFGAALQYFTGNKEHNILLRRLAIKKGLKLNEYGVYKRKTRIAGRTEKEVYQAIGLPYIEPELRTNTGEIEAGLKNELPKIIGYDDIKGETQCHTDWSDGTETIEAMAKAAKKMDYQYIVITDHAGFLKIANGLDEKRLLRQMREIDKIGKEISGIKILKGCEVDIKMDGGLAIKDEVLAKLDVVVAGVHSGFKMSKTDMTKRLLRAIENPNVDIIAHPTGRIIQKREGYFFDFGKIFQAAKRNKTALEINAYFNRLDLRDIDIRQVIAAGAKLTIGTDAHNPQGLKMMELGIAQARRGWATPKDILNAGTVKDFLNFFEK
ncbi:MAG: DNA polymerase III [Candidatus Portnoybacteria bacterium CG10_big_fil_rev_8_21_14_0_10_43_39]|uniref:DNA polymerase beta n=2 Tax=Candidatus Portnoyibacteriota TaxID=1817913 RepID=A0A2M7YKZ1_9BACT|nr:MAG: DNA polymerase III [Candidatus Portnoybacteria bacterium CG_4_9_14_3_um_filter_43_11]PJE59445.1 MAG: DNA polymerase III [Candidatus Portnoybacteria bacterium CG10_big_fil_rev_8_21_14_0_10_43_39]